MRKLLFTAWLATAALATGAQEPPLTHEQQRQYDILFNEAFLQRHQDKHDAAFDLLTRCREINPQASETWFFLAQYYSSMRQHDKALEAFQRAAELEPDNTTYLETLSEAYVVQGKYDEAIRVNEQMYENDKGNEELLETLYRLYLQQQDYAKGIDVLDRLEAIDGKSERIALAKSSLYTQLGEKDKAAQEIKELAKAHPSDMNYQTLYANSLIINKQEEEAERVLKSVLAEEPNNIRAQMALRNYLKSKQDSVGTDSITRLIMLNPAAGSDEKIYQLRQLISENEDNGGDSTQILNLFRELAAQPQPDADIMEMGAAYMDLKGMPTDSIGHVLNQVLQLAPDHASARLRLIQYAWEKEDNDRIIDLCKAARQYNPEEMAFYYYQGMAYFKKQDVDNALEAFKNGINVINENSSPDIVSDFYAVMGDLLFQKERKAEAYAAYDSCLQWKPDNIGCLNNYAYYLSLEQEKLEEAELMSYKTIKADPKNSTYLDTYAWILFMEGRYAEARVYIEQALQNDSVPEPVILEHAGDIYFKNGDTEKAIELWQQSLSLDPGNALVAKKIKRKKYLKK